MPRWKPILIPACVVLSVAAVVGWAVRSPRAHSDAADADVSPEDLNAVLAEVDGYFEALWADRRIVPAEEADALTILRRLSLALHGTIPSLQEIRAFEADTRPDRLQRWTARLLDDPRFADYFAERLARAFVGVEGGQFIVYRRDRFKLWLAEQLRNNTPYDQMVRRMIASEGLWTGVPETNFITAAVVQGDIDENKLAGRCVRAFLGQRMDCAQCHDHPFAAWKQSDFEGLAAHFGQTRVSIAGVEEKTQQRGQPVEYVVEDRETLQERTVRPAVPFGPGWWPDTGTRRERLAAWITDPDNRRFERAVANRMWALLFGRAYLEPVDDLPDPPPRHQPDLLDLLGRDFRQHGCDLKRLIRVIAGTRVYRLDSAMAGDDAAAFDEACAVWGVFPLMRLRPEQVIGSMIQAASLRPIDQNSHLLVRTIRFFRENDFIKEYGDFGEDELHDRSGTIPQALLRMNGNLSQELTEANAFSAAGRIAGLSSHPENCLETCFLVCLTRRPTAAEREYFLPQFRQAHADGRRDAVHDLFWTLFNSPEFAWNH